MNRADRGRCWSQETGGGPGRGPPRTRRRARALPLRRRAAPPPRGCCRLHRNRRVGPTRGPPARPLRLTAARLDLPQDGEAALRLRIGHRARRLGDLHPPVRLGERAGPPEPPPDEHQPAIETITRLGVGDQPGERRFQHRGLKYSGLSVPSAVNPDGGQGSGSRGRGRGRGRRRWGVSPARRAGGDGRTRTARRRRRRSSPQRTSAPAQVVFDLAQQRLALGDLERLGKGVAHEGEARRGARAPGRAAGAR